MHLPSVGNHYWNRETDEEVIVTAMHSGWGRADNKTVVVIQDIERKNTRSLLADNFFIEFCSTKPDEE